MSCRKESGKGAVSLFWVEVCVILCLVVLMLSSSSSGVFLLLQVFSVIIVSVRCAVLFITSYRVNSIFY